MRAYSLDLRERVVAAVEAGQSCRVAAKTFRVSVASVVRWMRSVVSAIGSPAAKPIGRTTATSRSPRDREWVLARVAEKPDITLRALVAELSERGLTASKYVQCGTFSAARG